MERTWVGIALAFCFASQVWAYSLEYKSPEFSRSLPFTENVTPSSVEIAFMGMNYPTIEGVLQQALGIKDPLESYIVRAFYGTIILEVPTNGDMEALRLRIDRTLKGKGIRGEVYQLHERGVVVHGSGP